MYAILYHPQAIKKLKRLHPNDQKRILEKLDVLTKDPKSKVLYIRKLAETKRSFRLRSGDVRAIFEIEDETKTIYVWDVDYRGSIY